MSALYPRALVVGKFAPLHRGHEHLLRHAEARCEQLYIISYTRPEFPGCEPARRAAWLADLFPRARTLVVDQGWLDVHLTGTELPHNDAPELDHRRFVARLCLEHFHTPVDAVFTSETYGDGFAAELARCFGLPVAHELVDQARAAIPISGTAVRIDVHAHRRWLPPAVYGSFVRRICLLGGECSGKTTLAAALARHFGTVWVPEYGREVYQQKDGQLEFQDMVEIAREQIRRENAAARQAHRWLFCDTSPLTTLWFSHALFHRADFALQILARRRYALHLLCDPAIPFLQDGTRQGQRFRGSQHAWYRKRLSSWVPISGTVEQRVQAVAAALRAHFPSG